MSNVRVRIAPSPTGFLHVGTARTALFNYLFAKKQGGKFILRVEDTDLERSDKKYEKEIFDGLKWLGIEADESPEIGGRYVPYRQSERIAGYRKYIEKLLKDRKAFYCFHSEKDLESEKQWQTENKLPLLHLCKDWRDLSLKEANEKLLAGEQAIIRFKNPLDRADHLKTFYDIIRHQVHFFVRLLGDFSIAKSLDVPLYNFAVVIDDYEMQISHVIRGEDHIPNTPKQLLIAEALGWTKENKDGIGDMQPPWQYAHLPLILGPDRSKLSKRHGATSINEYKEQGYLPEALFNFMALLGWNPGDNREIFSKDELIKEFSLEKIHKSGAIFDIAKLDWMNGEYIRKKSVAELTGLCKPYLENFLQFSIFNFQFSKEYIEKIIALEQPRLKKLFEIGGKTDYFFKPPVYDKELLRWKNMSDEEVKISLEQSEKIISNFQLTTSKEKLEGVFFAEIGAGDKGQILWPLRVALTGKKASPGPFEIIEILGKEKTLQRILTAKEII